MAQNTVDFSIDPSGDQLLDDLLTDLKQNILTDNSGTSRPAYALAGTTWIDTTTTPWVWKVFNGSSDTILGTINNTTLKFTPSGQIEILNNFTATTNPTTGDDSNDGYSAGSTWYNTVTGDLFRCVSAAVSAASWVDTGLQVDDLGTAAFQNTTAFATAAQGTKADSALQPADRTGANGMAMVLLDTKVASAASSLNFTSLISSTYDTYVFELQDIVPSVSGATFFSRFSSNNGSSWISANYDRTGRANSTSNGVTSGLNAVNQNYIGLFNGMTNVVKYALQGTLKLFNPLSTTVLKRLKLDVCGANTSPEFYNVDGYGIYNPVTDVAINAIQFAMDSGTFNGIIRMYGIRKT